MTKPNPKKDKLARRERPSQFEDNQRRLWVDGEFCPFHPLVAKKNREMTKFVHSSMIDSEGDKVFYKSCPKCYKVFYYPKEQQLSVPKILTPNENNN